MYENCFNYFTLCCKGNGCILYVVFMINFHLSFIIFLHWSAEYDGYKLCQGGQIAIKLLKIIIDQIMAFKEVTTAPQDKIWQNFTYLN